MRRSSAVTMGMRMIPVLAVVVSIATLTPSTAIAQCFQYCYGAIAIAYTGTGHGLTVGLSWDAPNQHQAQNTAIDWAGRSGSSPRSVWSFWNAYAAIILIGWRGYAVGWGIDVASAVEQAKSYARYTLGQPAGTPVTVHWLRTSNTTVRTGFGTAHSGTFQSRLR